MANVVVCDACGKVYVPLDDFKHIRVHEIIGVDGFVKRPDVYFDLCKDCYERIFEEVR